MPLELTPQERETAAGAHGEAARIALSIVAETGALLGADRLIPIASAHIDGCLYHGDGGTLFAEMLVARGARVAVPATLNIGALDLMAHDTVRLSPRQREMALRLMRAYEAMGAKPTFTCAPYQAGHRPAAGSDVAWGESNAVAFCNSVLGARTNRYGDFLDIACAICGRAPRYGLHVTANRRATLVFDASMLPDRLLDEDAAWPVLGALVGIRAGERVAALCGVERFATEDRLKAFGAAAASFGAVALTHVVGVTPEAADLASALQDEPPEATVMLSREDVRGALRMLSTAVSEAVSAVAVGSPHLSYPEARALVRAFAGRRSRLPFYANTGRHVAMILKGRGELAELAAAGATLVTDTCIVATPILPSSGVLMTNSGKFANYAPANIGHEVIFGTLKDCVETAVAGRLTRDASVW